MSAAALTQASAAPANPDYISRSIGSSTTP
jgi:hypothetical protein